MIFSATIKYELDRNREMIGRLLSDISFQSGAEHEWRQQNNKQKLSNFNFWICKVIFVSLMTRLSGGRLDQGGGGALRPDPVQVRKYIRNMELLY